MILPIVAYGNQILREKARPVKKSDGGIFRLISDMFETMYAANGVGLAAPQVNVPLRLFITDGEKLDKSLAGFKKVFINPQILDSGVDKTEVEEGCLSIPGIRENVPRAGKIIIEYSDENRKVRKEEFSGLMARIVQHEYDHLEGKLFIDYLNPFKKTLFKGKLNDILRGNTDVDYPMIFHVLRPKRR